MPASPLREKGREGEPLPHTETAALGEEAMLGGPFPASGPIPPRGHMQPFQVSQEGTVSSSTWRRPPSSQGGLLLWMVVILLLLLTHQTPLNSSQPRLAGWLSQTSGSRGERRPEASRANNHKPQCLHFSTPPPPGLGVVCWEGKGWRWGPQVISSRTGHSLASVSHGTLLSPLPA